MKPANGLRSGLVPEICWMHGPLGPDDIVALSDGLTAENGTRGLAAVAGRSLERIAESRRCGGVFPATHDDGGGAQ